MNETGIFLAYDVNDVLAGPPYPNAIYGDDYLYCGDSNGDGSDSTLTEEANGDITIDCQPNVGDLWEGVTVTMHYRLFAESSYGYLARQWAEIHNTSGATIDMAGSELYDMYYYNDNSAGGASLYTASDGATGFDLEADGQVWLVSGNSEPNNVIMGAAWGSPCKSSEFTFDSSYYFPSSVNVIAAGETVNLVTFVNMVFPAESTGAAATAANETALAQAKAEFDLGLKGRLAEGLTPGLNVAGWCGPDAALPDTGANTSVIGSSLAISAGLLTAGVLALVMVRRRLARK